MTFEFVVLNYTDGVNSCLDFLEVALFHVIFQSLFPTVLRAF